MNGRIRRFFLIFIIYGTMMIFGLLENIKGVSYPLIKTEFDASYEQQGLLVSLLSYSYVFFCLVAGFFLARFGVKRAFLSGFVCCLLGLGAVFFMPGYWTVMAALLLVYAGFGFFEVGVNALATQVFTAKAALLMSLLHFFYGAGAIIGPKAAGILIGRGGFTWKETYLIAIPLVLLFFIPALPIRFPGASRETADEPGKTPGPEGEAPEKPISFAGALKNPMVWAFAVTLGLMEVVEFSSANWGGLYFQDVYGLDPRTAGANFISNFYILFTLSRLVSGFAIEKIGYMRCLFIASFATVLVYALGFAAGPRGIYVLPVLGFFIAIMWPTIMAVAMGHFGSQSAVLTSAIIVLSGALNAAVQLLIGLTNRLIGAAWGYRSCILYALLMIGALILLRRRMARTKPHKLDAKGTS
ncbi:MAG: MFS transporter [Spirochaetaceae bacterium]|jgi:fucose permease|nr:MFS transporter [Spirochaetaceae bacterium]